MADPQMKEFAGRLRRIEKTQRRGGGFEATGTLGQSHYSRAARRRNRRSPLRPLVTFVTVIVIFKGFLLASLGAATYGSKIDALREGTIVEQIGAYVMTMDPFSKSIATLIAPLLG